jgi:hypothetical protein
MPDDIEDAEAKYDFIVDAEISNIRRSAAQIPPGSPGDCNLCGETFTRLIEGNCGRCRDRYRLP